MIRITKDSADQMVMDTLINFSKFNGMSSRFDEDSLKIINDEVDKSVLTGILITKAKPSFLEEEEINMKLTVLSSLKTTYQLLKESIEDSGFNIKLAEELKKIEKEKASVNTKLDFAVNQFINAFYEYERLEKKYPELMKIM
jgi:transcriptional regulator of heat shock response